MAGIETKDGRRIQSTIWNALYTSLQSCSLHYGSVHDNVKQFMWKKVDDVGISFTDKVNIIRAMQTQFYESIHTRN